jgi:hypothetical protein
MHSALHCWLYRLFFALHDLYRAIPLIVTLPLLVHLIIVWSYESRPSATAQWGRGLPNLRSHEPVEAIVLVTYTIRRQLMEVLHSQALPGVVSTKSTSNSRVADILLTRIGP